MSSVSATTTVTPVTPVKSLLTRAQFLKVIADEPLETDYDEILEWAYELNPAMFHSTKRHTTLIAKLLLMTHQFYKDNMVNGEPINDVLREKTFHAKDANKTLFEFIKRHNIDTKNVKLLKLGLYTEWNTLTTIVVKLSRDLVVNLGCELLLEYMNAFPDENWGESTNLRCLSIHNNPDILKLLLDRGQITIVDFFRYSKSNSALIEEIKKHPEHSRALFMSNTRFNGEQLVTLLNIFLDQGFDYCYDDASYIYRNIIIYGDLSDECKVALKRAIKQYSYTIEDIKHVIAFNSIYDQPQHCIQQMRIYKKLRYFLTQIPEIDPEYKFKFFNRKMVIDDVISEIDNIIEAWEK